MCVNGANSQPGKSSSSQPKWRGNYPKLIYSFAHELPGRRSGCSGPPYLQPLFPQAIETPFASPSLPGGYAHVASILGVSRRLLHKARNIMEDINKKRLPPLLLYKKKINCKLYSPALHTLTLSLSPPHVHCLSS